MFKVFLCLFTMISLMSFQLFCFNDANNPENILGEYESSFKKLPTYSRISKIPWSGSYWPYKYGGIARRWNASTSVMKKDAWSYKLYEKIELEKMSKNMLAQLSPSEKYDIISKNYHYPMTSFERSRTNKNDNIWFGICNGRTAASLYHEEPHYIEVENSDGINVPFYPSDIKALLSHRYANTPLFERTYVGERCDIEYSSGTRPGFPSCDNDINAGAFHIVLANSIGTELRPIISDISRNYKVRSRVFFGYDTTVLDSLLPYDGAAIGTQKVLKVRTKVKLTAGVTEPLKHHMGSINVKTKTYDYYLELNSKGKIIGGKWITWDHPDFLWTVNKQPFADFYEGLFDIFKTSMENSDGIYCPYETDYDLGIGMCVVKDESEYAIGPFPSSVVKRCISYYGQNSVKCQPKLKRLQYSDNVYVQLPLLKRDIVAKVRGVGSCPKDHKLYSDEEQFCSSSRNVYGPFSYKLINRCKQRGHREKCFKNMWERSFFTSLL